MTSSSAKVTMMRLINETGKRMKNLSSYDFYQAWQKYDTDNSGYIEDQEVEKFLKEFLVNLAGMSSKEALSPAGLKELSAAFLAEHDKNKDGKISIEELSSILPTDQKFLLVFRFDNPLDSSEDFMVAWKKYDADKSGYIEAGELEGFLKDVLKNPSLDKNTINEYTKQLLEIFDSNKDGKLSLGEAAQLLPVKQNFIHAAAQKTNLGQLSQQQIATIFKQYDRDNSGFIQASEIDGLSADIVRMAKKDYTQDDINTLRDTIIKGCDMDGDGKINEKELAMIIGAVAKST
ncbi:calbindin-32-like [Paramacrobiotus metropolitanus]|uniref:calbindin-32-like n=1 Tax=Paramacrobiotus metropolitanus TaxID=2943436 RepID=UPI0024462595|nr:calbindin-32-like [Paramacrobiotus metropolitanus]